LLKAKPTETKAAPTSVSFSLSGRDCVNLQHPGIGAVVEPVNLQHPGAGAMVELVNLQYAGIAGVLML
jgi:hypothetical protein